MADMEENGKPKMPKEYAVTPNMRAFAATPSTTTLSERRALLRRLLADLAVAMAEAETEPAYAEMRNLFEATVKVFRGTHG
jgi:hypothetical protein